MLTFSQLKISDLRKCIAETFEGLIKYLKNFQEFQLLISYLYMKVMSVSVFWY
jgi:hypothetical protein